MSDGSFHPTEQAGLRCSHQGPLPRGLADLFFEDAAAQRALEQRLRTPFGCWSYSELIPPAFEYADTLASEAGRGGEDAGVNATLPAVEAGAMRSGQWAGWSGVADYRAERLGDVLVERLVWGQGGLAEPGCVWFRFWLPHHQQVVEKRFDAAGQAVGMQINVCTPLLVPDDGWSARDLLLNIWITPEGRVTVRGEAAFEHAVREGVLSAAEAERGEQQVRYLTAAIAQDRFPPALVRNWQIDVELVKASLSNTYDCQ